MCSTVGIMLCDNMNTNKANRRDLIAPTGLVILLKLDSNHWFFSLSGLEIWWMTSKNDRAHLLYCIKVCASFQIHQWIHTGVTVRKHLVWFIICASFHSLWWIQTGVTIRKRLIWVKIDDSFSSATLKFERWPCKITGHLFYNICYFKLFPSFRSH